MDLSAIRRQYALKGLHREDLAASPVQQFETWLNDAIASQAFTDPTAMCLSTVAENGMPSQRMVLLKHADENGFVFFTNLESRKAQQIQQNPHVSLHFPWLALERQVIVSGIAEKLSIAEVTKYFLSRPKDSQIAAWASQQSRPIGGRKLLEQAFEQMKNKFSKGEVPLPGFWGGFRVKPVAVEFWQGRENRLHDRFLYEKDSSSWVINRLQP